MRKLIKKLQENIGLTIGIALILVFSVGATVSALSSPTNQTFTGEIKNLVINNPVGEAFGEVFGGTTADDWNVGGNLSVTGTSALTGSLTGTGSLTVGDASTDTFTVNGQETKVVSGTCANATTTLAYFVNPFAATSTVDYSRISITGVSTTTIDMTVGTTTSAFDYTTNPSDTIFDDVTVSTSTQATLVQGCTTIACETSAGTNSKTRVEVGTSEYIAALVGNDGGLGSTAGVTNASNTFDCSYTFRFVKD